MFDFFSPTNDYALCMLTLENNFMEFECNHLFYLWPVQDRMKKKNETIAKGIAGILLRIWVRSNYSLSKFFREKFSRFLPEKGMCWRRQPINFHQRKVDSLIDCRFFYLHHTCAQGGCTRQRRFTLDTMDFRKILPIW